MSAPAGPGKPLPPSPLPPPRRLAFSAGGYSRPLAGFIECGDTFVVCMDVEAGGDALLVAVVDGLGHGKEAAVAAQAAARIVHERHELPVDEIMRHCNRELQSTRGAAMGVLRALENGSGEFCGIGNIEVQILAGQPPGLFCLPGIVGHNLRTLRAMPFTMQAGDIYCLHTDGVSGRGSLHGCLPGAPETVARCIVDRWGRRHDDATAVVLGYGAGAKLPATPGGAGHGER
jgi:hypothetical protein